MRKLILGVICIICVSCVSFKETRSIAFFNQWRNDTEVFLLKNKPKTELEKNINEILNVSECFIDYSDEKQRFEKLEYKIYPEFVKVTMYNHLKTELFSNFIEKEIFVDSLFKNTINCTNLKTLILTDKYKEKLPKKSLGYGFGSFYEGKNKKTAKAILENRGKGSYYRLSEIPNYIEINQAQDTAIVYVHCVFDYIGTRYVKENNHWKYDKKYLHFAE